MPLPRPQIVALFPTSGAIAEDLQVGRTEVIEQITDRALGGQTLIFAEDRHLGKSSVLSAMVGRSLREPEDGRLVLSVDLRDGIPDSTHLARALLSQASKQGAGARISALANKSKLSRLAGKPAGEGLRAAARLLDLQDEAAAVEEITQALSPAGASLERALKALDGRGRAVSARTIVVLDEAQELVDWADARQVQNVLAATIKRAGSTVNFIFSGSEKHTLTGLFETPDTPLHGLGVRYFLPEITSDDWVNGLRDRYAMAQLRVEHAAIHQILYYSQRLPLPTMLVCFHTLDWLDDDQVTMQTVEQAVRDARRQPSWELPA